MILADAIAFDHILNYAIQNAKKSCPTTMEYQVDAGNNEWKTNTVDSDTFFRDMSGAFLENGLLNEGRSWFNTKIQTARSVAFAMHAINNIDTAGKIKSNIDKFFNDEKNGAWFEEHGLTSDAEKEQFRADLKKHVDEKLEIKTKTNEAQRIINRLKLSYDSYAGLDDENAFYKDNMSFLYSVNQGLMSETQPEKAVQDAYRHRKERPGVEMAADWLHEVLEEKNWVRVIADEIQPTYENVQNLRVFYGEGIDVKPSEFLHRMNKNSKMSTKEKLWATEMVQNILEKSSNFQNGASDGPHMIQMRDFMLNGKPMFSEDDLAKKDPGTLACQVIANVLNGENVSVDASGKGNFVHVEPKFYETMSKPHKGFFERLYDLIVNLFSTKEKDKVTEMQQNISEKAEENKNYRKKMTIDNLVGSNAADKVTRPPTDQKEMSTDISKKGKGASAKH